MANAVFNKIVDTLVNHGGVPEDQASMNLSRLLKAQDVDGDSVTAAHVSSIMPNLEGIIILRGDKTKLDEAKPRLTSIAQ